MTSENPLSERDICPQVILPAIEKAGLGYGTGSWEQIFFPDGRYFSWKGRKRAGRKKIQLIFILYIETEYSHRNHAKPKDNNHTLAPACSRTLDYAGILNIPLTFSSRRGCSFA